MRSFRTQALGRIIHLRRQLESSASDSPLASFMMAPLRKASTMLFRPAADAGNGKTMGEWDSSDDDGAGSTSSVLDANHYN